MRGSCWGDRDRVLQRITDLDLDLGPDLDFDLDLDLDKIVAGCIFKQSRSNSAGQYGTADTSVKAAAAAFSGEGCAD